MKTIYEVKEYSPYKSETLTRHITLEGAEKHLQYCIGLYKEIGIEYTKNDKSSWLGSNGKSLVVISYGVFE